MSLKVSSSIICDNNHTSNILVSCKIIFATYKTIIELHEYDFTCPVCGAKAKLAGVYPSFKNKLTNKSIFITTKL